MATRSSTVREARRRRILERESDRLALITGRFDSLPPTAESESLPPSLSSNPPDQPISDFYQSKNEMPNEIPSTLSLKHDSGIDIGQHCIHDTGHNSEPVVSKRETSAEALRVSSLEPDKEVPLMDASTARNSSISTSDIEHRSKSHTYFHKLFSLSKISSAIAASEITRICCSISIAILVVLSYIGFPVLDGFVIENVVISGPLYLVLMTNATIVLARLVVDKQSGFEVAERPTANASSVGNYGFAEHLGRALESGLAFQNIMAAVFMDCSVYAIAVICGLTMAQGLMV